MNDFPHSLAYALSRLRSVLATVALLVSLGLGLTPSARAQIAIDFTYNGTNTTVTYFVAAGSLSTLTSSAPSSTSDEHNVRNGGLVNVSTGTLDTYVNPGFTNTYWGSPSVAASSFSGDQIRFFVGSSGVRVPTGYDRANASLSGSMTWNNVSLMDLGFASNNAASGSFAALGTTVNWSTTNSAIPEPGTYAALCGLVALGYVALRRRTGRA